MDEEVLLRLLQGREGKSEREQLERALRAGSPEGRAFRRAQEIWELTGPREHPGRPIPDPALLIARAEGEEARATLLPAPGSDRGPGPSVRPLRAFGRSRALAALLATLLFAGWWAIRTPREAIGVREIATRSGETVTLTLEDGTEIRLGPRSTLRLSRRGRDRIARLEGRAFFEVARDRGRTFTVQTRHGEAVVLGTSFEVRSEASDFEVLVVEGRVRMNAGSSTLEVGDRTLASSVAGGAPEVRPIEELDAHLAWMERTLVLHGTTLREAIFQIEQRYGVRVLLEDPGLGELTIHAAFTERPLGEVVTVLCAILNVECTVEDALVRIGRRPEGPDTPA